MDSETVHGMVRSGAGSVPDTGLLIWKSVDPGWRLLRRGVRPPKLLPGGLATICPATRRTMPEIWTEGINKEAGIFEIKFIKLTSDESLRMVFQEYKKTASVSPG